MKAATYFYLSCVVRPVFQSTPPVKAATQDLGVEYSKPRISIHAAREGGDAAPEMVGKIRRISIHAAREGGDGVRRLTERHISNFNPRRP